MTVPTPPVSEPLASPSVEPSPPKRWWWGGEVQYPNLYVWLVFFASLDVMLTWIVLTLGGSEVNPVADAVVQTGGLLAMSIYKFVLVSVFVLMCEAVGRMRDATGRTLAWVGVAIAAAPVVWTLVLLTHHVHF